MLDVFIKSNNNNFFFSGSASGPLSVLYECMKNGIKAKIWVRRYKGLRGCLTGYIAAFDNHMNLVSSINLLTKVSL